MINPFQYQWKSPIILLYEALCSIWYYLYNLKNVKNTHGGRILLVKLQVNAIPPRVFLPFLNGANGSKSRKASLYFKGCVRYIFASLICMSKREHLWNKEKCFLLPIESCFCSWDNYILTFQIFKCHDVIKCPSKKYETHFIK